MLKFASLSPPLLLLGAIVAFNGPVISLTIMPWTIVREHYFFKTSGLVVIQLQVPNGYHSGSIQQPAESQMRLCRIVNTQI